MNWLSWLESRTCGINQRVSGSSPEGGAKVGRWSAFFILSILFLVKESRALEVVNIILKENERVHYNEAEVFRVLKDAFVNGASEDIQHQHRERIKDMIGKHRIFE